MKISIIMLAAVLAIGVAVAGKKNTTNTQPKTAIAVMHATVGNTVSGVITFTQKEGYVLVEASIKGLTPGKHGFHIHQFGNCSSPKAKSAGGHFNPKGHKHGAPTANKRHHGDLGNLQANGKGHAKLSWKDKTISLSGKHTILGRGVIIHAGEDDLKSQPTGAAGGRVACGVIGIAR